MAGQENQDLSVFFLAAYSESVGHCLPITYEPAGAMLSDADIDNLLDHFIWTTPSAIVVHKFYEMVGASAVDNFLLSENPFTKITHFEPWRQTLATVLKVLVMIGRLFYSIVDAPVDGTADVCEFYLVAYPIFVVDPDEVDHDSDDEEDEKPHPLTGGA